MTISRWILLGTRSVSDTSCRENHNTYFTFSNFFFPKIVPFMRYCGKIWWSQRGHRWQDNTGHTRCTLDKESCACARASARAHTLTNAVFYIPIYIKIITNTCFANAPQCYVIRTLLVSLNVRFYSFITQNKSLQPLQNVGISYIKCFMSDGCQPVKCLHLYSDCQIIELFVASRPSVIHEGHSASLTKAIYTGKWSCRCDTNVVCLILRPT